MCGSNTLSKLRAKTKELNIIEQQSSIDKERELLLLMRALTDMVIVVDETGLIKYANPSTYRVLGYDPIELVGKEFGIVGKDIDVLANVDEHLKATFAGKTKDVDVDIYIGELKDLRFHLFIVVIKGGNTSNDTQHE